MTPQAGLSPVIVLLEVADGDEAGTTAHGKLVLLGRPADAASGAVDPQDDQRGLPHVALERPHVGVAVRTTGDDAVALRRPVDA